MSARALLDLHTGELPEGVSVQEALGRLPVGDGQFLSAWLDVFFTLEIMAPGEPGSFAVLSEDVMKMDEYRAWHAALPLGERLVVSITVLRGLRDDPSSSDGVRESADAKVRETEERLEAMWPLVEAEFARRAAR